MAAAPSVQRPGRRVAPPAVSGGILAGAIRGQVVTGSVTKRFRGPQILMVTLVLAVVGAPLLAAQGPAHRVQTWLGGTELYAVALLLVLMSLGRNRDRDNSSDRNRSRNRNSDSVIGAMAYWRRAPQYTTQVSRFQVETLTGQSYQCSLTGEPVGGRLKDGDSVHVTLRRSGLLSRPGSAQLAAREVVVLSSANGVPLARIVPARRGSYAAAARIDRIALGLAAVLALGFVAGAVLVWSA